MLLSYLPLFRFLKLNAFDRCKILNLAYDILKSVVAPGLAPGEVLGKVVIHHSGEEIAIKLSNTKFALCLTLQEML